MKQSSLGVRRQSSKSHEVKERFIGRGIILDPIGSSRSSGFG